MYLTLDLALKAANEIKKHLDTDRNEAVIAICDSHGELIVLLKTDNAPYSSIQIAMNKAYTAARERRNSMEIGDFIRDKNLSFDIQYWGDPKITGFGGGLVISAESKVIGGIGVSGLSESEDIRYAAIGLTEITNGKN